MSLAKSGHCPRGELARVLVVDDESGFREFLDLTVARMGLSADCAASLAEARRLLEEYRYQLCLTDMRLPGGESLEIVRLIGELYGDTPVAVITAFGSAQNAVAALKAGAFDYLAKPVALEQLRSLTRSALNNLPQQGNVVAREQAAGSAGQLIGESAVIENVRQMIDKLTRSQAPVYISGESVTSKDLAACLIHDHSARHAAPSVPVNCGAIPEKLMESEFFGYRKGAFTDADSDRDGFFQVEKGGTPFLGEVADLPLLIHVKLLRAIQEKNAQGEQRRRRNRRCAHYFNDAPFVQGLRRRRHLSPGSLLSSERHRAQDAAAARTPGRCRAPGRGVEGVSFSGNVRELENVIERATALCSNDTVVVDDLQLAAEISGSREGETLDDYINCVERQSILEALAKTACNLTAAASLLGVTFRSLRYRIERLGIEE